MQNTLILIEKLVTILHPEVLKWNRDVMEVIDLFQLCFYDALHFKLGMDQMHNIETNIWLGTYLLDPQIFKS